MDRRPIVILTALQMEAKALADVSGDGAQVHVMGIRAARMPRIEPGTVVIVAGLGGGLDPSLRVGDLVLDTECSALPSDLPWRIGPIHTAPAPATTPAEKASLFRETGALAVDMEQAIVRRSIPTDVRLIGLRAISDPADMTINPAVLQLVDGEGRPKPLRIFATLLRHPPLLKHLGDLKSNSEKALRNLSRGIRALLETPTLAASPPSAQISRPP